MHILFGKKKTSKDPPKPTSKLSPTFAQEVLALEEQLNISCTDAVITRLMSLYKLAIEHYEAEKNPAHLHYQERMHSLLARTSAVLQLSNPPTPLTSPRPVLISSPRDHPITSPKNVSFSSHKPLTLSLDTFSTTSFKSPPITSPKAFPVTSPKFSSPQNVLIVKRSCEKVLNDHKTENLDLGKKIHENLKSQADNLSQRLLSRKLAQTPKHVKSFTFESTSQFDISAGEIKMSCVEEFENSLESILEKYLVEKEKEKRRIKELYLEYFEEIEGIKGEVRGKLEEELKKNMEKEIEERMREIDRMRQDEIASARTRFLKNSKFNF